jgi:hypothetical protein
VCVLEGFIFDNNNLVPNKQEVTLNGQNKVALDTPLCRVHRLYDYDSTSYNGTIYVYEDDTVSGGVPQTSSKIHITVVEGNQSEKAANSTGYNQYLIVTGVNGYCFSNVATSFDLWLEVREVGGVNKTFRRILSISGKENSPVVNSLDPPIIIKKNSDIRITVQADKNNRDIGAFFSGYTATVIK